MNIFNEDLLRSINTGRKHEGKFIKKTGQLLINDLRKLEPNTELIFHFKKYNTNETTSINIQFMKVSFKKCPGSIPEKSWSLDFREKDGKESFLDLFYLGSTKFKGIYMLNAWLTLKR